jgi:alpha-beta hydrolase superfamily lysophospholipase
VLYGQSMGGASLLRAIAELGVEPAGIVVESTFDRLLSTVRCRFHRMGLPATPFAELLVFWGSVRLGVNGFAHDPVEFARSVRCPALVLQGDRDPNVTTEQARAIHASLGAWKRYSEYTKTGHQDVRTADRARWTEDVSALLVEVRANTR